MRKKLWKLWERFGFYVSLAVVLSLIGGTAVWYRNRPPSVPVRLMVTPSPVAVISAARATPEAIVAFKLSAPLSGVWIVSHSPDQAVYDETLMAYTAHAGIDIAGSAGTAVHAAAQGTVSALFKSPEYGYTIKIEHGEGKTTLYGGLMSFELIALGDKVLEGQIIGALGSYPCRESAQGIHLHFEVFVDGVSVDPDGYF